MIYISLTRLLVNHHLFNVTGFRDMASFAKQRSNCISAVSVLLVNCLIVQHAGPHTCLYSSRLLQQHPISSRRRPPTTTPVCIDRRSTTDCQKA